METRARKTGGRWRKRLGIGIAGIALVLLSGARRDRPPAELEAKYATEPSKFLTVGGLRIHYRDEGTGPVVVLVHGSNSSLFTWDGWAAALRASYRVIRLDLPGHGLTGPDAEQRYAPAQMAELVLQLSNALGVQKFSIAGNSMGGNVSLHLALLHPEAVEKLVLVDAAGLPRREPKPFGLRLFANPVTAPLVRWITPSFMVRSSVRDVYGDPARMTPDKVERYEDLLLREGNRQATRDRLAKPDQTLATRLGDLRAPTLILWGSRDRWILPAYGEEFHEKIPHSKLVVLEGLGHVPMEEDPVATAALAQAFLGEP